MVQVNEVIKLSRKDRHDKKCALKRQELQKKISDILIMTNTIMTQQDIISEKIDSLIKKHPQEVKLLKKNNVIKMDNLIKSGVRYKQGFTKSVKLSESLTTFLKISDDSEMSISEIVNCITKYIREHKLQDPSNRKAFNPDDNLQKLFESSSIKNNNGYTYYGIQKYIKPHLICS